jgi:inner membrane protein
MLPVDLPVLPLAVLLGATAFLGLISHLFADALTVGRDAHAIRPFHPLSPYPLRFGLVRADSLLANSILLISGVLFQSMTFIISMDGATGLMV